MDNKKIYRSLPIAIQGNVCKLWQGTVLNLELDRVKNNGNITGCDLKAATYVFPEFVPRIEKYPKALPKGAYKIHCRFYKESENFMFAGVLVYGRVLPPAGDV